MKTVQVPFLVAAIGCRDVLTEDEPRLRDAVETELHRLARCATSLHPCLLTSLADGTSQLAADVALKLGWRVMAILPMALSDYEREFATPASLTRFRALLAQCSQRLELPAPAVIDADVSGQRGQQYRDLGRFFVRHAQIVIALWDGCAEDGEPGEPAEVVRFAREGVTNPVSRGLPSEDCAPVSHILCRSRQNPSGAVQDEIGLYAGVVEPNRRVIESMRKFVGSAHDCSRKWRDVVETSKQHLLGKPPHAMRLPESLEPLVELYGLADTDAIMAQSLRRNSVFVILGIVLLAVLSHEFYTGLVPTQWMVLAYLAALLGAFAVHRWAFKHRRCDERYLDYRALAEGLRVQLFWSIAGEETKVSDHYLLHQATELGWIRVTLRNIALSIPPSTDSGSETSRFGEIRKRWLEDQRNYFVGRDSKLGKAHFHDARAKSWNRAALVAFFIGLAVISPCLISDIIKLDHPAREWLLVASTLAIGLAGIFKAVEKVNAHKETSLRYLRMGRLYDLALKEFNAAMGAADVSRARHCLTAIGREALAENAEWLLLHRDRPFEVPVGN
ncbi:hypothetical protein [Paraburkholderia sp. GAS32]|uniref:hypothetical protein n=1 Tax=Paraburkholderia sp. GAS32 TaxID=3035129 RepID=UPI003D1FF8E9